MNESDPEIGSFALNLTSCSFHVDSIRAVFSGGARYTIAQFTTFNLSQGEFRLVSSPQEPPFSPPPLPDPSLRNLTSMVYVQATTYVAESASWAFWKAGLMAYNVTNDKVSKHSVQSF